MAASSASLQYMGFGIMRTDPFASLPSPPPLELPPSLPGVAQGPGFHVEPLPPVSQRASRAPNHPIYEGRTYQELLAYGARRAYQSDPDWDTGSSTGSSSITHSHPTDDGTASVVSDEGASEQASAPAHLTPPQRSPHDDLQMIAEQRRLALCHMRGDDRARWLAELAQREAEILAAHGEDALGLPPTPKGAQPIAPQYCASESGGSDAVSAHNSSPACPPSYSHIHTPFLGAASRKQVHVTANEGGVSKGRAAAPRTHHARQLPDARFITGSQQVALHHRIVERTKKTNSYFWTITFLALGILGIAAGIFVHPAFVIPGFICLTVSLVKFVGNIVSHFSDKSSNERDYKQIVRLVSEKEAELRRIEQAEQRGMARTRRRLQR